MSTLLSPNFVEFTGRFLLLICIVPCFYYTYIISVNFGIKSFLCLSLVIYKCHVNIQTHTCAMIRIPIY